MTRMRISLVTLGDPAKPTGGYLYHRRLAKAAPAYEAEISFVSFPDSVFPLPRLARRRIMRQAADADVVVVDSIAAAFVGKAPAALRPPVVGMLHQAPGGIDHGRVRTRVQAWLDRRAYRSMAMLLVASDSLAEETHALHADVRIIAPGRDVSTAAPAEVGDLRCGRRVAFVCVANWIPRKGIADLVEAFARLPERAATLHLVGDEDADPRYAKKVRRRLLELGDRVRVHGVVPQATVAGFYRAADAFVMPSYKEPYGTVYGEAMAWGLPVVGWRAGNLPYLADDGREALIVAPGDVSGLATALRRLSDDQDLRRALGRAALARASTFATWEQTAETFFGTLRSAIEASQAR